MSTDCSHQDVASVRRQWADTTLPVDDGSISDSGRGRLKTSRANGSPGQRTAPLPPRRSHHSLPSRAMAAANLALVMAARSIRSMSIAKYRSSIACLIFVSTSA